MQSVVAIAALSPIRSDMRELLSQICPVESGGVASPGG
jgi:hypothetical protein